MNLRYIFFVSLISLMLLLSANVKAQKEPIVFEETSVEVDTSQKHSTRLATILSAGLPGAGQFYNKKYWKIPVIYIGGAALIYSWNYNNKNYHLYRRAYNHLFANGIPLDGYKMYSKEQLQSIKDQYRKYRDLSIICITLLYVLNIVDATVDAHLFDYDIGDDLSLRVQPDFMVNRSLNNKQIGLRLSLQF